MHWPVSLQCVFQSIDQCHTFRLPGGATKHLTLSLAATDIRAATMMLPQHLGQQWRHPHCQCRHQTQPGMATPLLFTVWIVFRVRQWRQAAGLTMFAYLQIKGGADLADVVTSCDQMSISRKKRLAQRGRPAVQYLASHFANNTAMTEHITPR